MSETLDSRRKASLGQLEGIEYLEFVNVKPRVKYYPSGGIGVDSHSLSFASISYQSMPFDLRLARRFR